MIIRALSSGTAGLVVTTALLYVMQFLIATGENVLIPRPPHYFLDWIDPPEPPDSPVVPRPPDRIPKPEPPPFTDLTEPDGDDVIGVEISAPPPSPPPGMPTFEKTGFNDGPLVNLMTVQPAYPAAAAARGLEGTVIVQFDVTEFGTVENAVVVESSNRIFNKAAIDAAYRLKYKPRVVDGIAYATTGLRMAYTFKMSDSQAGTDSR